MKSAILAASFSVLYLVLITAVFRLASIHARARVMTLIFLLTIPLFAWAHRATPPDLGFIPPAFVEANAWLDVAFGAFLYAAAFFGGILQLYNLADRGFSLRMLIDIDELGPMDANTMVRNYSAGKGIGWMYQKRLDDMIAADLAASRAEVLCLTPRGRKVATLFGSLRRFLRLPA